MSPDSSKNGRLLFSSIEQRAKNYTLKPQNRPFDWMEKISGLLTEKKIDAELEHLKSLSVDDYIARVLEPAESPQRQSTKSIIKQFKGHIYHEVDSGPLYSVEIELEANDRKRRVGIIAQNRSVKNGVWGPEHHLEACKIVREFSRRALPIVTFMDTPGADAGAEANLANQAHTISRLIAEMANAKVPTVGLIYGLGYSGGAIPLATSNILLAVRHGVFNTIQPKGLASIARQFNLSWQESARYVGISPCELYVRNAIDGIIDWDPEDKNKAFDNLIDAIFTSIECIENAARDEVAKDPKVLEDYAHMVESHLNEDENFQSLQKSAGFHIHNEISEFENIYAHAYIYLRSLLLRTRIKSATIDSYGRLAEEEIPQGDLDERTAQHREESFESWHADPEKLIYNDRLSKAWKNFKSKHEDLSEERNRLTSLILGDPQKNYDDALKDLCFATCLYLYNRWKSDAEFNFVRIGQLVSDSKKDIDVFDISDRNITLLDVLYADVLKQQFLQEFENLLTFDALYNTIVNSFGDIAEETKAFHTLSQDSLRNILDTSIEKAATAVSNNDKPTDANIEDKIAQFAKWLAHFVKYRNRGAFLKNVEEWKRVIFPRMSESLLVLITFFFEDLIPEYMDSELQGKNYQGTIKPGRIGKRKDFWNQLNIAYQDLMIQRILDAYKRQKLTTVDAFKDTFFDDFQETSHELMTANPVSFPGFRLSIEKALNNNVPPCGIVTGIASVKIPNKNGQKKPGESLEALGVGVVISNIAFQAGAFDMASAEKLCALLLECADKNLPIVCFISSGGMQTKEGASSLFSMAIVNDRITHFISETQLPIIVFGFGNCTGGSQASFATHPLVHTYYLSGTDMPFAGRIVVPSFLPSMNTVSNYLVNVPGSMHGLVKHPFAEGLDEKLKEIDPSVTIPDDSVQDIIIRVLKGTEIAKQEIKKEAPVRAIDRMDKIEKVLIHGRGCTAVKLIRIAQKLEKKVLLVQSDPDMDSVAVDMLDKGDEVVCLGGQTPDESYLNGASVITIASRHGADSLHPGIGFLSENASFARLCRKNGLNFIGPKALSMDTMGNKSNAISTAMNNETPVVPGSHGILTSAEATAKVADEIGYPVLLKAVHGGGGKGIKVVRNSSEVRNSFNTVFAEARSAFGNGDLYLEKFVESMRHIEIQILRDTHGNTKVIGLRDCTVQRNNQKVLEESGSTMLPEKLEKQACESAVKLADAVDYFGAGTVEFIYDLASEAIYFMEMNTRLQVEHPVTEWTTGVQIVSEQFHIAEGGSIADLKIKKNGFAIEARITAEKARLDNSGVIDFIPTPGLVTECKFPKRDDMEIISTIDEGKTISPFYDSMVAQLILHGKDRNDAIKKLIEVLEATSIKGVCTNIPLLLRILNDETFVKGDYDTNYLPTFLDTLDKYQLVKDMEYTGVENVESDINSLRIEGTDELKVISPMTGIFYSTSSPNDPDYVSVGAQIKLSSTLCLVEAMKLFTQLSLSSVQGAGELFEADKSYEIVRINQSNTAQINAGDLLFVVRPID